MTRMQLSPWSDYVSLRDAVNRLFEDSYVRSPSAGNGAAAFVPAADAWEDDDKVTIEMVVPGADMSSVDITYEPGSLTVSGEIPAREQEHRWVLRERPRGRFERRFTINVAVDAERSAARMENGVLVLELPMREDVKPRKITVAAG